MITKFPKSAIITQNIDGLATKIIDNIPVIEIHGNNRWIKCIDKKCGKIYEININKLYCICGYWCRPDIVVYGEKLAPKNYMQFCILSKNFLNMLSLLVQPCNLNISNSLKTMLNVDMQK
jgi:NAD-dependent SIR2 family protein deacetylase